MRARGRPDEEGTDSRAGLHPLALRKGRARSTDAVVLGGALDPDSMLALGSFLRQLEDGLRVPGTQDLLEKVQIVLEGRSEGPTAPGEGVGQVDDEA